MNKKVLLLLLLAFNLTVTAQKSYTINGHFPNFPNSDLEVKGYEGLKEKTLFKTSSNKEGKFILEYPFNYQGAAQLYMNGAYATLLILNKENYSLYWEDLTKPDDLKIIDSKEYNAFLKGMKTYQDAEAKLAGLNYLVPLYAKDSLKQKQFVDELNVVSNSFPDYIKSLPDSLFIRQFLLAKGLIEQMPKTVETYQWRAPAHIAEFMAIDLKVLKHSGLFDELLNGYTNLVEKFPQDEVYLLLNGAIDKVITELEEDPILLENLSKKWFALLEKKSLFKAAEHLALSILDHKDIDLDASTIAMFEHYRTMAIGKTAPDVDFGKRKTLKQLKNKYKLIVFGSSSCPSCTKDYPKLLESYSTLNQKYDLEIIYIALDTDQKKFENYYKNSPFITFCNAKGWDTQAVKDYHVFATPTYILLNNELKIVAKLKNITHLKTWLKSQ